MHNIGFSKHVITKPVSTIDIAPTLLNIAGVPKESSMQGTSLIDVLGGTQPPRSWATSRLRKSTPDRDSNRQTALRANNMKLVVVHGDSQKSVPATYRLFDLDNDAYEQEDLASNAAHLTNPEDMMDLMIDARYALEDRTEPRIAKF